jgi:hypothetical protein
VTDHIASLHTPFVQQFSYILNIESAIKEMRDRVVKEFRKLESSTGVSRQKWDAKVRMRQAKLRAIGQTVGRAEMLMIMMEETINKGRFDAVRHFASPAR